MTPPAIPGPWARQSARTPTTVTPVSRLPIAVLLLALAATSCGNEPSGSLTRDDVLDRPFELVQGGTTTLAELNREDGRPLVVNLWATWCAPCLEEMPDLEAAHQDRGDEIRFVGLNISDSPTRAAQRIEEIGITYLLGQDPDGGFVATLGAVGLPTTAFIDRSGELVRVHQGQLDYDGLQAAIDEYLS
ncbi:MAG: TlpA family protein disulfide reductase [Actinobacteria bacterium]|nr:TlpA family protein disulfide reductase [Actinomycetota bacterium]MBT3688486.1 TlpA family protein disulfide reductase [Actinomycetota bacterium]MBT4038062.1 TlpA family protein disulfide reductase [Actinomycetota bacterium]MBT4279889.1 TlpA family protein disulfide reductase [Actinomycetota bacterium]MBT4343055.1 TlpA family protein disulfide reductase [Actinomycetota bacterium]